MRRALAAAAAGLTGLLLLAGPLAGARVAADPVESGTLRLQSQTAWVDPTANPVFDIQVATSVTEPPANVRVVLSIYNRISSRSDFTRTLAPNFAGYVQAQPVISTLDSFHPNDQGVIDIKVPVGDGSKRVPGEVRLPGSGVYPVSVDLRPRQGGTPYARLVTTMLYTAAPVTGPKLGVVWIAPLSVRPPAPSLTAKMGSADQRRVSTLVDAMATHPGVPFTVDASADTISQLADVDPETVSQLGRSLQARELLAGTWVPTALPAMLQAGLADQVSLSLTRSTDALGTDLGAQVTGRTWVQQGPVDAATLSFLRGAQFDRVVLPETDLGPNPSRFTIAQPFEVAGSDRTPIRAAVADAGLAAHFSQTADPVLAAHQLLGDLATIYGDAPANARGVVVVTPPGWAPNAGFLDAFLSGLASSPILSATTVDDFFDTVPPIVGPGAQPAVRDLVTDEGTIHADSLGLFPDRQRSARSLLSSLSTALPADSVTFTRLERILLEVPSVDLSPSDRLARLAAVSQMINASAGSIALAGPRTITLTERKGRLPLNVVSSTDAALHVRLHIKSDKLSFPGISNNGNAELPEMVLHKGNNPLPDLTVEARTAGRFPISVTVTSPDNALVFERATFTVQSTALSGVGVFLSVGAAVFLLLWWGRHAWRSRRPSRGRGRHAKGAHAAAGDDAAETAAVTASTV